MFEHVGYKNYDVFFQMINRCLEPNGRCVLHTIISTTMNDPYDVDNNTFINTYIFPGGQIPNNDWILDKIKSNGLNVIHFESFGGQHYAKTLDAWRNNMLNSADYVKKHFSEELLLKFDYYFSICRSGFITGNLAIGHYIIVHDEKLSINNSFNY